MEINDAIIEKLSSLARLKFSETEKYLLKYDLQKMIAFVQKMDELNTDSVEPLLHMTSMKNTWREDEIGGSCEQQDALKNASQHGDQFFLVPKIIQK